MKKFLFLLIAAYLPCSVSAQMIPGLGWSHDTIWAWCTSNPMRCTEIKEIPDNAEGTLVSLSFVVDSNDYYTCYFDSTGACYQIERTWLSVDDSANIADEFSDTSVYTKVGPDMWRQTLYYGEGRFRVPYRYIDWSWSSSPYDGGLLVGRLEELH